jgi:hypothetical protein
MQAATMIGMDDRLLTILLDEALTHQLEAVCANTGRSRGEIVCDALRRQTLPFGEAAGWLSDEDVFRAVS